MDLDFLCNCGYRSLLEQFVLGKCLPPTRTPRPILSALWNTSDLKALYFTFSGEMAHAGFRPAWIVCPMSGKLASHERNMLSRRCYFVCPQRAILMSICHQLSMSRGTADLESCPALLSWTQEAIAHHGRTHLPVRPKVLPGRSHWRRWSAHHGFASLATSSADDALCVMPPQKVGPVPLPNRDWRRSRGSGLAHPRKRQRMASFSPRFSARLAGLLHPLKRPAH